jgi:hypothetical protein
MLSADTFFFLYFSFLWQISKEEKKKKKNNNNNNKTLIPTLNTEFLFFALHDVFRHNINSAFTTFVVIVL